MAREEGSENAIKLYRLVHDVFTRTEGARHILWAYHTTLNHGAWTVLSGDSS